MRSQKLSLSTEKKDLKVKAGLTPLPDCTWPHRAYTKLKHFDLAIMCLLMGILPA